MLAGKQKKKKKLLEVTGIASSTCIGKTTTGDTTDKRKNVTTWETYHHCSTLSALQAGNPQLMVQINRACCCGKQCYSTLEIKDLVQQPRNTIRNKK